MIECQMGYILEHWRDQLRDRSERQGTWSGPGGGP